MIVDDGNRNPAVGKLDVHVTLAIIVVGIFAEATSNWWKDTKCLG